MAFCSQCGQELSEDATSCSNCDAKREAADKSNSHRRRKKRVAWFLMGLLIISATGGVLYLAEQASLPYELRVEIARARLFRDHPPEIQAALAQQLGKTIEELSTSPYDRWAPKVLVGLLCAWGGAWAIYLAYSFFRFVDREEPGNASTRQFLM